MKLKDNIQFGLIIFIVVGIITSCKVRQTIEHYPDFTGYTSEDFKPEIQKVHDSLFTYHSNYLLKNRFQQWELYLEGDAMERGIIGGALMDSLMRYQEDAFVEKIDDLVPNKKKQMRLLKFLGWYNRKIYKYFPNEYQVELYGLAKYMTSEYNYIGPAYLRNLYYHGAHDIGHALVDFSMVQCTSAGLWGSRSADGELILGRNLDFYLSDRFAENKVVLFVNPKEGIPFVSVTWPGMMGVVSGMNYEGLTITMNAGKSKIPWTAKEPISILARNILEHASTTEEAIAIAQKSEVFVSEALMVSSAKDNKVVIIEVSPKNFGVYEVSGEEIICSNHFQSDSYRKDKRNKKRIETYHSMYRYERMQELLDENSPITPTKMAAILRDKDGLGGKKIGYGNEKAINQLICHHGVVFKPEKKQIWISTSPYNLGAFTAYDLNEIFGNKNTDYKSHHIDSLTIPTDSFLYSSEYANYEKYRTLDKEISRWLKDKEAVINTDMLEEYRQLNPDFWYVHYNAGVLYYRMEKYEKARDAFKIASDLEITTTQDKEEVMKMLKKATKKVK
ncbi:MAG: C45 family peptidase [Brumimicrobium sp.]|nr:C45 family peptidase [Brumimicrobium sp.]